MRSDADKLVHRSQRREYRPFFYNHVSGKGRAVHQHGVIADLAIVADMQVGHDEGVITHTGGAATLLGSATDSDRFADEIMVADLQIGADGGVVCVVLG